MDIKLNEMRTEKRNPKTINLDILSPLEIVTLMNEEDAKVHEAVAAHLNEIAKTVSLGIEAIENGGRIIYMGAGTSGRLGVLDAAECPPTFGVSPETVTGLIAGGETAFTKAVEGAEDSMELGENDLKNIHLCAKDLVIGIAASGRTPYVMGGLEYARSLGCHTAALSCNPDSQIGKKAEIAIDVVTGPEVLSGSTRLKAGTATKMVLNMISTAVMAKTGRIYQNLMVDVIQTNEKLKSRALRIVTEATGCDQKTAISALREAEGSCKKAIVMILADVNAIEAENLLADAKGHVREALEGMRRP